MATSVPISDDIDMDSARRDSTAHDIPRLEGSALVRAYWYELRHRPAAERAQAAEILRDSLPVETDPTADAEWITMCDLWRRFASASGRTSSPAYSAWRKRQSDHEDLPSADQLRRRFGGPESKWSVARAVLGDGPAADATVLELTALGAFFTEVELVAAARLYAKESEALTLSGFLRWGRQEAPLGVRVPRDRSPIKRLFGGFPNLLLAAGLQDGAPGSCERESGEQTGSTSPAARAILPPETVAVPLGVRTELLTMAQAWVSGKYLSRQKFATWADEHEATLAEGGREYVSAAKWLRECRTWPQLLVDAGLISEAEARRRIPSRGEVSLPRILECAGEALAEYPALRIDDYLLWRNKATGMPDEHGELSSVPSYGTVLNRLGKGSWRTARQAARAWVADGRPDAEPWLRMRGFKVNDNPAGAGL